MPQSESSSILRDALRDSLIKINDDGNFASLQTASEALSETYAGDRKLLLRSIHAIQDPAATPGDPALEQVAEAIEEEWITFRGNNAHGALSILRVTAIAAVDQAIAGDHELTALVWYEGAASMARYESHDSSGTWREVVERAGDRTAEEALDRWALTSASVQIGTIPQAKAIESGSPTSPPDGWALRKVHAALANLDQSGAAITNGNPNPPAQYRPWAEFAAQRLSNTLDNLAETIQDSNAEASVETVKSIQAALNSLTSSVRTATRNALNGVIEAQEHLDRRSRLLWWSRTLHSTSLDMSYRSIAPDCLPFVVALDAQALVGPFAPLSVESLIREVVQAVGCEDESVPELADALSSNPGLLSEVASNYAVDLDGRTSLVRHLAAHAVGAQPGEWVDASAESRNADARDLAVWIYRSAQAHSLAYDA